MRRDNSRTTEEVGAWEQLALRRDAVAYARGALIYTPNHPADDLLLLCGGQVALHMISDEGRALTIRVVEPGELFGQIALGEHGNYDTFAEALTPATIYRISRADVRAMIEREPSLGLDLLEDLTRHRQAVSRLFDEVAFKSVPARLATLLLDLAESGGDAQPSRVARRSHRQLAERINAYRETVTKVINQFRAARLLEIDRSFITLLNPRGLEELAQG
ncbi:MAG TPA: Crp/Fnr family transcriptional regulator [Kouleothrix sp.]|uniref:Crp/Fnr family transcriptional regulator n=1 Tax=Kouleothrix sp. TaxID=2779161 RepID=UPI002CF8AB52|nr:Crp/Fnr family transcriptional regulator [Kouleothrix sp.]HRC75900.1 Crp/Fnr family transcriptional regulator [Kouleothrix sp.]